MKIKLIIPLLLALSSTVASSQNFLIYSGVEKTVSGNQYGTSMLLETYRLWAVGVFYQASLGRVGSESLVYSNPFYGMIFQAPLAKNDRISFFATLRTGLVNDDFYVMVPSLETRIDLSRQTSKRMPKPNSSRYGICIGTGFRYGYPSISGKVFLKL